MSPASPQQCLHLTHLGYITRSLCPVGGPVDEWISVKVVSWVFGWMVGQIGGKMDEWIAQG